MILALHASAVEKKRFRLIVKTGEVQIVNLTLIRLGSMTYRQVKPYDNNSPQSMLDSFS